MRPSFLTGLTLSLLLPPLMAAMAIAADVSGTVIDTSPETGRIYLRLEDERGNTPYGTGISSAGDFTIRGVAPGAYRLYAFRDSSGSGVQYASSPCAGGIPVAVNGDVAVGTVPLTDPGPVPSRAVIPHVVHGDGADIVRWESPGPGLGNESYNVSWGTGEAGPETGGVVGIPAGRSNAWFHATTATGLYYRVESVNRDTAPVSSGWIGGSPPANGVEVTGTVTYPAQSGAGTLVAAIVDPAGKRYVTGTAATGTSATYRIPGVTPGEYQLFFRLYPEGEGGADSGAIALPDTHHTIVAVGETDPVVVPDIFLPPRTPDAGVSVATRYHTDGNPANDRYLLCFLTHGAARQPVSAVVAAGPNLEIPPPVDLGRDGSGSFRACLPAGGKPTVGDRYTLGLTFADGAGATVTVPVAALLDAAPLPIAPVGPVTGSPDRFSWDRPAQVPPDYYAYGFEMEGLPESAVAWIPARQTTLSPSSIPVALPPLQDAAEGTQRWTVRLSDRFHNEAYRTSSFTVTDNAASADTTSGGTAKAAASAGTVSYSGVVRDSGVNHGALPNVRVEISGSGAVSTFTNASGGFTLPGIPAATPFTLRLSYPGDQDSYSAVMTLGANAAASANDYYIQHTASNLAGWGVTGGRGAIRARVTDLNDAVTISGATVTAVSSLHPATPYTVKYTSGPGLGGTATAGDGLFYVLNVDDGDSVTVSAGKTGWLFTPNVYETHGGAVSQNRIRGDIAGVKVPPGSYFRTFSEAYATFAAPAAKTVQMLNMTIADTALLNKNIAATVRGGYDAGFAGQTGFTTLQGALTVAQGSLIADRLVIR